MRMASLLIGMFTGTLALAIAGTALYAWMVEAGRGIPASEMDPAAVSAANLAGVAAVAAALAGILGAALTLVRPRLAATLMFVAGLACIWTMPYAFVMVTPLFLVAALLAFLGRRKREAPASTGQARG